MRKVELSLKENYKYQTIKKLVETNGNKERARIKLGLKNIRQIYRMIDGYKKYGKEFFSNEDAYANALKDTMTVYVVEKVL